MRVLVLGAKGQLGSAIVHEFGRHAELITPDRSALDITDAAAVREAVARAAPDVIINCAGNNAVDAAEDHPVEALAANAFAVRSLARAARAVDAALVQYSSDFVFDGTVERPHIESETPNPRSVYAMSKMLGEWFAADAPRHYVLRVESLFGSVPGGPADKGSVSAIVNGLRAGSAPRVFEDRTVSPTFVRDAARATREILERRLPSGIYHCVNSGACTWLEFAEEAARLLGLGPKVTRVRFADVTLKAPRPKYCALSNAKLVSAGVPMPPWQEALRRAFGDDARDE
jgi:dTDP-4-dehydrorhamnose reductase